MTWFRLNVIRFLVGLFCVGILKASQPAWWSEQHVVFGKAGADDTSIVKTDYVADIVRKAVTEFNLHLPGGAGEKLNKYAAQLSGTGTNRESAVTIGKLLEVAEPFYDRLHKIGYHGPPLKTGEKYPWETRSHQEDDLTTAHIRDIKELFSFDLSDDRDGNKLPDWWEAWYGVSDPNADDDGDGVKNSQEWLHGTDPDDFYNGQIPRLTILSGNGQTAGPNRFTAQPIIISVQNAAGQTLSNAPVTFSGKGRFAAAKNKLRKKSLTLRSNADGIVQVYYSAPNDEGESHAKAEGGSVVVQFTAITDYDLPPAAPGNVVAEFVGDTQTRIRWTDMSDDEYEFLIQRRAPSEEDWVIIGRAPANSTSFLDTNAPRSIHYYYRVSSSYGGEY